MIKLFIPVIVNLNLFCIFFLVKRDIRFNCFTSLFWLSDLILRRQKSRIYVFIFVFPEGGGAASNFVSFQNVFPENVLLSSQRECTKLLLA